MKVLVTGAAGFIGYHLTKRLLENNIIVDGLDNLNSYYDVSLKLERKRLLENQANAENFKFYKLDISCPKSINNLIDKNNYDVIINLAAQAGVRHSLEFPEAYIASNLYGFINLLEACKSKKIKHFIFASSSSVYGANQKQPFSVHDRTDEPISLYAATKKSNEVLAHSYSHLYNLPVTGLRFFTVYGPYGRPDMAYYQFTKKILKGEKINVFNNGDLIRDFTHIEDIVDGLVSLLDKPPGSNQKKGLKKNHFRMYNLGNNSPVALDFFIKTIESACGKKAMKNMMEMQPGDVPLTYADIDESMKDFGFKPKKNLKEGINEFVQWYKGWEGIE